MNLSSNIAAIVTGAGSGLGAAVATHLANAGVKVALFEKDVEKGTIQAEAIGGLFVEVDVSDAMSVSSALAIARATHGQERLVVNCAGIAPAVKTVSRGVAHDAALFETVIGINLIGSFFVSSQSAAGMVTQDPITEDGERGLIINTASVAAFDGQIGQTAYAASKGGIASLTLPMARDLADKGIRVMAIAPGIFGTPMVTSFPQDVQDALASQIPFPARLGNPNEFAALVRHIAENRMLNGEIIRLDGAIRMPPR